MFSMKHFTNSYYILDIVDICAISYSLQVQIDTEHQVMFIWLEDEYRNQKQNTLKWQTSVTALKYCICMIYVKFMVSIKIWLVSSRAKLTGFAEGVLVLGSPGKVAVKTTAVSVQLSFLTKYRTQSHLLRCSTKDLNSPERSGLLAAKQHILR